MRSTSATCPQCGTEFDVPINDSPNEAYLLTKLDKLQKIVCRLDALLPDELKTKKEPKKEIRK